MQDKRKSKIGNPTTTAIQLVLVLLLLSDIYKYSTQALVSVTILNTSMGSHASRRYIKNTYSGNMNTEHYFIHFWVSLSLQVPLVLRCCSEFVETHGIVDGIYRLSGVSSNIQKLRYAVQVMHPPLI